MDPPSVATAIRFGILGAAQRAPNALVPLARSHGGVTIRAITAPSSRRDESKSVF